MYGIERAGLASGRKYFGDIDWYKEGADRLLSRQNKDGSFNDEDETYNPRRIPDTAFSLLFLLRGRAPVVLNKLEYATTAKERDPDNWWNQRPRDAANFAAWMSKQSESFYNWQIVNLKAPDADLHDAPLLYIAGSEPLGFTKDEVAKLKRYVEDGGILLGNADCARAGFSESFKALGSQMFPAYEFRAMPPNHPIYVGQQFNANRWKQPPKLMELNNGVRSLMILIAEEDVGRSWQSRGGKDEEALQLGADLYFYASDKNTRRFRCATHIAIDEGKTPAEVLKVARIEYTGNWNPEAGAWRRMDVILRNEADLGIQLIPLKLDGKSLAASGAKLAHLTGTVQFTLTDSQRAS